MDKVNGISKIKKFVSKTQIQADKSLMDTYFPHQQESGFVAEVVHHCPFLYREGDEFIMNATGVDL